jgi:hypothetical protein
LAAFGWPPAYGSKAASYEIELADNCGYGDWQRHAILVADNEDLSKTQDCIVRSLEFWREVIIEVPEE